MSTTSSFWLAMVCAFVAGGFSSIWLLAVIAYAITKRKQSKVADSQSRITLPLPIEGPRKRGSDLVCIQRMPNWRQ